MGYAAGRIGGRAHPPLPPQARLFHWKENAIAVTVTEHAITVGGPVFALRMLQQKLAA